jgi:hypothetical protein
MVPYKRQVVLSEDSGSPELGVVGTALVGVSAVSPVEIRYEGVKQV